RTASSPKQAAPRNIAEDVSTGGNGSYRIGCWGCTINFTARDFLTCYSPFKIMKTTFAKLLAAVLMFTGATGMLKAQTNESANPAVSNIEAQSIVPSAPSNLSHALSPPQPPPAPRPYDGGGHVNRDEPKLLIVFGFIA